MQCAAIVTVIFTGVELRYLCVWSGKMIMNWAITLARSHNETR